MIIVFLYISNLFITCRMCFNIYRSMYMYVIFHMNIMVYDDVKIINLPLICMCRL